MQTLEQRIQQLEDIEAIRRLKAAYCDACDNDHDGDAVAALFTEDGSWQHEGREANVGKAAIAKNMYWVREHGGMRCSAHIVSNPDIEVDGDRASGNWRLVMMFSLRDGQSFYRIIGRYEETYVRKDGRWLFQTLLVKVEERGPYTAMAG